MNKIYDFIVIGCGLTGITLCKKLRERGYSVLVLEKNSHGGGLCTTKNVNGHTLDVGGGHFFHTKHQCVFDYVFKYIPERNFNYINRVSKIEIDNETIDYPIESNIWQLSQEKYIDFLISIIRNGESQSRQEPKNYEEWIRWKLGDKICEKYMLPYNKKLWGTDPKDMDIDWLYKIPRVNVREILKYCIEKTQDKSKFPAHINFYYPKFGGFQTIFDAIAKDELENVVLNCKVEKISFGDDYNLINDIYKCRNIINTVPWCDIYQALGSPEKLKKHFDKIKYNRIVVSLHEIEYSNNWHWRYIPDEKKLYHREFFIRNFAFDSKPNGVYLETNEKRFDESEFRNIGKLIYKHKTDAAYPIPIVGSQTAITEILQYYKQKRMYGVGRWGQHQYQNADVSMYNAIKFAEEYGEN